MLRAQPLAVRMVDDEGLELGHQACVATGVEVAVDSCLERGETTLVEADCFGAGERLVCDVGEGAAAQSARASRSASRSPRSTSCVNRSRSSSSESTRTR